MPKPKATRHASTALKWVLAGKEPWAMALVGIGFWKWIRITGARRKHNALWVCTINGHWVRADFVVERKPDSTTLQRPEV